MICKRCKMPKDDPRHEILCQSVPYLESEDEQHLKKDIFGFQRYRCESCNVDLNSDQEYNNHIKMHQKKGCKNDFNYMEKPPLDLLTLEFLTGAAQALGFGAEKYGRQNFKGGIDHSRLIAATLRHINQYNDGQDTDSESGLSHLSHAAASLNMLMWMINNRPDLDDRYKK